MKELVYDCTLYIEAEENETVEDAISRLERILNDIGIQYNLYNAELRNN